MSDKPSILIVDDEENVVRSLSRTLRDQFNVLTATSGEAALDILQRQEVAVILTDQRMPGLTGVQLLESAKRLYPQTVGVLISGYSDGGALVDALNLGIVRGFIPKPWDTEELRRKLNGAVQQFEAVFNDRELLHDSSEAVVQARTQLAELRRIFDLVSAGEVGSIFAAAEGGAAAPGQPLNRAYLDHLSDGFVLVQESGHIVYCNAAGNAMLGLNFPADAELFSVTTLSASVPLMHALQAAFRGEPAHAAFPLTDPNGKQSFLEAAATPMAGPTEGRHAVIVVRDQTEQQQNLAQLMALKTVADAIAQSLDLEQRVQHTLAACREAVQADGCFIYFLDAQAKDMRLEGALGFSSQMVDFLKQHPVSVGQGMVGEVAASGLPKANARMFDPELAYPQQVAAEGIVSTALAPLRDSDGVSGVLGVFTRSLRKFSDSEISLLLSIGSQVGLALRNARQHEQLRVLAHTDPLTGLFNRRYFLELAEREYRRARRQHLTLSVLMLDLNRFKSINDRYGHAIGDRALLLVAGVLTSGVRSIDLICRYGGDEFAIVLPDCAASVAQCVAERLAVGVDAARVETAGGAITLSVSIGLAAATLAPDESLESLLIAADAQMYAVKARERGA